MSGDKELKIETDEESVDSPVDPPSDSPDNEHQTIEQLSKERDEYRDLLQRKQAEFENYRKRTQKEKARLSTAAKANLLRELLAVLDAGEKGLESLFTETGDARLDAYREGYELLINEVRGLLDRAGVEPVPGPGSQFDPNLHEAVLREESETHDDGEILEEYRRGFVLRDLLLRPSQVKVAVRAESGRTEGQGVMKEVPSGASTENQGDPADL